jgi:hypothetical protein
MIQVEQIDEKIAQAPDKGYEIGVVIGSYLPFVILVIIAYATFYYIKNKKDE